MQRVLDYIQWVKIVAGELAAAAAPQYGDDYLGVADPAPDWYKTPLLRATKPPSVSR